MGTMTRLWLIGGLVAGCASGGEESAPPVPPVLEPEAASMPEPEPTPEPPPDDLARARALADEGRTNEALEASTRALERSPDHVPTLWLHALLLVAAGNDDDARAVLRHAASIDPGIPAACFNEGGKAENARDRVTAASLYGHALALGLPGWRPASALGFVQSMLGRQDEAFASYTEALARNPAEPGMAAEIHRLRALARMRQGRLEDAVEDMDAAVAGGAARAFYSRGILRYLRRDRDGALADFRTAVSTPDETTDYNDYARLREWQVQALLEGVEKADPGLRDYLEKRGRRGDDDWFHTMASAVLKNLDQEVFNSLIEIEEPGVRMERLCELTYFRAAATLLRGKDELARLLLESCRLTGILWFDEYVCAGYELKWMKEGK